LRAAGLDVVVVDKAAFPRDKVCAGWITPEVVEALRLDVDDYRRGRTFQPITGFRTGRIGGPAVETDYARPVSFAIRRCEFDDYLLRRSGARLQTGTPVTSLRRLHDHWIVNEELRAPVLVGAGGHFCPVARHLHGNREGEALVVAQEVEFRIEPDRCRVEPGTAEIYFSPDLQGYGWCVHKGDFLNVGLGRRDPPERLSTQVRDFVAFLLREGRLGGDMPSAWRGHAYRLYERTSRRLFGDGVLLVGDAAGLAYPASGEGILPAVESGLLAAEALLAAGGRYDQDRLEPYRHALEARRGPRGRRTTLPPRLLARISGPLLRSPWFARHVVLERLFLHRRGGDASPAVTNLHRAAGGEPWKA